MGSVSPLLAIKEHFGEADYLFLTTKNGPEADFLTSQGIRIKPIASGKWRRYWSFKNVLDIFNFAGGLVQSIIIIKNYQPDIILTSGGFVAVPVAIAGRLLGRKVFVHQQDIELGLANKIMARFADVITVTFSELQKQFPGRKVVITGNPVRKFIRTHKSEQPNSILILGGSQGSQGLNDLVALAIPDWKDLDIQINHVLGTKNFKQRLSLDKNYTAFNFVKEEMGDLMASAKVVITRGGISVLTELSSFKKPIIIVPMPGSHQVTNALFFAEHRAAVVVEQHETEKLNETVRTLLGNEQLANELADNLHQLFVPAAADNYVQLIKDNIALNIDFKETVYVSGLGGIGTSALAQYFLHQGYNVCGSDLTESSITDKLKTLGIKVFAGQHRENIPKDTKLFVHSSALPSNHEEIVEAKRRHIPVYTYNEYLGKISKDKYTIAVSGTNGKTTTTGLAGFAATQMKLDPTIIVGGLIPQLQQPVGNYRPGKSPYFIVEACEWRSHMLNIQPQVIIMTNIEEDHLDYFRDLQHIQSQFQKYIDSLPDDGLLIRNLDDPNSAILKSKVKELTYGLSKQADYRAEKIDSTDGLYHYELFVKDKFVTKVNLNLHGQFNVMNSLAVFALFDYLEYSPLTALPFIEDFRGSWRRFEKLGQFRGCPVYTDYAHHPTAIIETIAATRRFYPKKKILAIFQPHLYSRTEALFDKFAASFTEADEVIITATYDVAGRHEDRSADPAEALAKAITGPKTKFISTFDEVKDYLKKCQGQDMVLLFMGAGDIDILARKIASHE